MDAKQFALAQIGPYFKDPTTCGYDGGTCVYLDENSGKMCVAGKNMINPSNYEGTDIKDVLKDEVESSILKPEAIGKLTPDQWYELQRIHDRIAMGKELAPWYYKKYTRDRDPIEQLGLFTYDELVAYAATL